MSSLQEINTSDPSKVVELLEPLIERAPQIAANVGRHRPFASQEGLVRAIERELNALDYNQRLALFRAHPELAPDNPLTMTGASQQEQGRLGLTNKGTQYKARLDDLNRLYTTKHGFPFITALVRHDSMDSVLDEFETRLNASTSEEMDRAVDEIVAVSAERVRRRLSIPQSSTAPEDR